MASIRGILNIQSLNELTSENRITQCQSLLTSRIESLQSEKPYPMPYPYQSCQFPTVVYCTHNPHNSTPSSEYTCDIRVALSHNTCSCRSSDHGGPQRFRTGRQPHIHMLLGLGQNEACAQPGGAPPEATQAASNQP